VVPASITVLPTAASIHSGTTTAKLIAAINLAPVGMG
jgi:hypothetical protein